MKKFYHEYELKEYSNYRLIRNCNARGEDDMSQCWLIKRVGKNWEYESPRFTSVTDAIEYIKAQ